MSFFLTISIPKDSKFGERHFGSPKIVDGLEWRLVAKLRQYPYFAMDTYVQSTKIGNPVRFAPEVSLTYQAKLPPAVERFDTSRQQTSTRRWFAIKNLAESANYEMSVTVKLEPSQATKQKSEPLYQSWQQINATIDENRKPTSVNLENRIVELKKEHNDSLSKVDGKYEQKCAKLEEIVRKLEDRLQRTEDKMEGFRKQEEAMNREMEHIKLKASESEASMKEEINHLKVEVEAVNEKMIQDDKEGKEKLINEMEKLKMENRTLLIDMEDLRKRVASAKPAVERMYKSEESMREEVQDLKAELEIANQKVMQAETKFRLLQHVVVDTEAMMADLKEKLEAKHCEEALTEKLAAKATENEHLNEQVGGLKQKKKTEKLEESNRTHWVTGNDRRKQYWEYMVRNKQIAAEKRENKRKYVEDVEEEVKELSSVSQKSKGTVDITEVKLQAVVTNEPDRNVELSSRAQEMQRRMREAMRSSAERRLRRMIEYGFMVKEVDGQMCLVEQSEQDTEQHMNQDNKVIEELKKERDELMEKNEELEKRIEELMKTEDVKKPSYLEKVAKNNRLAAEIRARNKKYMKEMKHQEKEPKSAIADSQGQEDIADVSDSDYELL